MSANRKQRRAEAKKHGLGKLARVMDVMEAETEKYLTEEEYQRMEDYAFEKAKRYVASEMAKTLPPIISEEMQRIAEQVRQVTLASCAKIIMENGGYLHRLETREAHLYEVYTEQDTNSLFNEETLCEYLKNVAVLQLTPIKIRMEGFPNYKERGDGNGQGDEQNS